MDKKLMAISTSMLVLKLLEKQEMYGYQLIKELELRSEKVFQLKEGTLYPILHGLEQQNAIESFEQIAETGRIRKYYKITDEGRKLLKEKTVEWNSYQNAVNKVLGGALYE
ncbi:MAG: transcriptional regulator, PadR-like family [Herbinix sp.]|jgi:PadR family transcriptional regulator PadR|nr:transcriptional regulator, PadR-like family [Herbinix sp.]